MIISAIFAVMELYRFNMSHFAKPAFKTFKSRKKNYKVALGWWKSSKELQSLKLKCVPEKKNLSYYTQKSEPLLFSPAALITSARHWQEENNSIRW